MRYLKYTILLIGLLCCTNLYGQSALERNVRDTLTAVLRRITLKEVAGSYVKVESTRIRERGSERVIEIRVSKELAYYPMRRESVRAIYDAVRERLPEKYRRHTLLIYTEGRLIDALIPHYYSSRRDEARFRNTSSRPLITRTSDISQPSHGLKGRHIALWQSHGRYFDNQMGMWRWQRSRLWETVEDLYTQGYVIPFLVPMLERAGATVLLPRERSMRREELIIDNDRGIDTTTYSESGGWQSGGVGFAHLKRSYPTGHNPFTDGSCRQISTTRSTQRQAVATWSGYIPRDGLYTVYVSYATLENSTSDARYTVHATGGDRLLSINQRMGGGMWVALGEFYFEEGERALVTLTNLSSVEGVVTADAVKVGGGVGNIRREVHPDLRKDSGEYESCTSGYPRFTEGARYWLQWSGFSPEVYAPKEGRDDYRDDYMSRPQWVNALMGGSEMLPEEEGKHIPIDLALAFHSDAGVRLNDDIIGTLGIYCTRDNDGEFEGEVSRLRSRDLTDLVMTQIVDDLRSEYEPRWTRRGMWDRSYYEARVGWCPTMLLELLSHQNFADMRYGLDPSFRFTVSRAIYKGVLRYLSSQYNVPYIVQPLPVHSFSVELRQGGAYLSWEPTEDTLEPTAAPDYYILYTRVDDGGFDTGRRVDATSIEVEQDPDKIYSYRLTAVNKGGESFPSETLAACRLTASRGDVMVVNGFDRVAAPLSVQGDSLAGFHNRYDSGCGYIEDISFIGEQHNFDRRLSRSENDNYALGQCYNDYETEVIAGNTFDYVALHGGSIREAGYSFSSSSRRAVEAGRVALKEYDAVDLVLGKQRTTAVGRDTLNYRHAAFGAELKAQLRDYASKGGSLLVTGSYALTDLWHAPHATEQDRRFAEEVLGVTFGGNMATRDGCATLLGSSLTLGSSHIDFCQSLNADIYCVESPEVIAPVGKGAQTILRYTATNQSAGVARDGSARTVVIGFPFETIATPRERDHLMQIVLNYLVR